MHTSDNHETAIKNTRSRGIPALLEEVKIGRIFKDGAAFTGRRRAWFEDTDRLSTWLNTRVAHESVRIATNTDLRITLMRVYTPCDAAVGPHTIVPLLSRAPLAQNELVKSSRGVTVLLARFHNAPHAE